MGEVMDCLFGGMGEEGFGDGIVLSVCCIDDCDDFFFGYDVIYEVINLRWCCIFFE